MSAGGERAKGMDRRRFLAVSAGSFAVGTCTTTGSAGAPAPADTMGAALFLHGFPPNSFQRRAALIRLWSASVPASGGAPQ